MLVARSLFDTCSFAMENKGRPQGDTASVGGRRYSQEDGGPTRSSGNWAPKAPPPYPGRRRGDISLRLVRRRGAPVTDCGCCRAPLAVCRVILGWRTVAVGGGHSPWGPRLRPAAHRRGETTPILRSRGCLFSRGRGPIEGGCAVLNHSPDVRVSPEPVEGPRRSWAVSVWAGPLPFDEGGIEEFVR